MQKKAPTQTQQNKIALIILFDKAVEMLDKQIQQGNELLERPILSVNEFLQCEVEFSRWNDYNSDMLLTIFNVDKLYREYNFSGIPTVIENVYESQPTYIKAEKLNDKIKEKINTLISIKQRLPLFSTDAIAVTTSELKNSDMNKNNKVFIVHGRNDALKQEVARVLEKLGLEPIILHEQPNSGMTIIEKLETYSNVGFAIILLTPDDEGKLKGTGDTLQGRARQNVIAELGYFVGKLGRNRVCPLYIDGVELPSDFDGVAYTPYDKSGGWKLLLGKELLAAGYKLDLHSLL